MQNLKYPRTQILINSVTALAQKIGLYPDLENMRRVITLKDIGVQITGAAYTAGDFNGQVPAGTAIASGLKIVKSCTDPGDLSGWCVTLNAACPCDECDYDYGITFRSWLRDPGYTDNSEYTPKYQWYGNKIERISCTAGLIDDEYLLSMEDDILTQVTNDANAWMDGYRSYVCTVTIDANPATITITDENGTATTVSSTGACSSLELEAAINADAATSLYVHAIVVQTNTTGLEETFIIRSLTPGYLFTVTAGTATTVVSRSMCFNSKSVDRKIIPQVEDSFASISKYTLVCLSATTTAGTTRVLLTQNGVATLYDAQNDNNTPSTYAAALNGATTPNWPADGSVWFTGNDTADLTYLWGNDTVDNVDFTFSTTSTTVISYAIVGEGHFPYLTSDDVFRIFSQKQHMGNLQSMIYAEQPIDGSEYCHYHLESQITGEYNLHGANHLDGYYQTLDIYILKGQEAVSVYDKDAGAGGANAEKCFNTYSAAPDTTFEQLLEFWAACLATSW